MEGIDILPFPGTDHILGGLLLLMTFYRGEGATSDDLQLDSEGSGRYFNSGRSGIQSPS